MLRFETMKHLTYRLCCFLLCRSTARKRQYEFHGGGDNVRVVFATMASIVSTAEQFSLLLGRIGGLGHVGLRKRSNPKHMRLSDTNRDEVDSND
jgi:hypothetical protein